MLPLWGSGHDPLGPGLQLMRDYMDCPCCGSRLVVVGQDLLTLEEAQDSEMDSRIERDLRQGGHSRMGSYLP